MPTLSIQQEYALQKVRQEKIEKEFVWKRVPIHKPSTMTKKAPLTFYEKYVSWLID